LAVTGVELIGNGPTTLIQFFDQTWIKGEDPQLVFDHSFINVHPKIENNEDSTAYACSNNHPWLDGLGPGG
jgi:hypothetical protein